MLVFSPLFSSLVPSIVLNPASDCQAGNLVIDLKQLLVPSLLHPSSTAEALPPKSAEFTQSCHLHSVMLGLLQYLLICPWGPPSTKQGAPLAEILMQSSCVKTATFCSMPSLYDELLSLALATTPVGRYYYFYFKETEVVADGGCMTCFRTHS